jgi:branched chain amino acid efflux pump
MPPVMPVSSGRACFALGVGFGVVVTGHGLPWWLAPVISGSMFAGSVEFLLAGLIAASAPIAAIALTTFLINSRHLFYGLSFPLHRVKGWYRKAYSVFALCDESYALRTAEDEQELTSGRMLWTQLGLHASWASGALVGGLVGASFLTNVEGLDFVLTALFVVLVLDAYRTRPDRVALALATAAAISAFLVAPGSMLLVAMSAYTVALVVRHRMTVQEEPAHA